MKYLVLLGFLLCHSAQAQTVENIRLVSMSEQIAAPLLDGLEDRIRATDSDYKPMAKDLSKMGIDYSSSYLYVDKTGNAVAAAIRLTPEAIPTSNEIMILLDPFTEFNNRTVDPDISQFLRYQLIQKIFQLSDVSAFKRLRVSTAPGDFITLAYIMTVLKMRGFQQVEFLERNPNRLSRRIIDAQGFDPQQQQKGSPSLQIVETVADTLIDRVVEAEVRTHGGKVHVEIAYALEPDIKEIDPIFCADLFGPKN